jgi:Lon protease-like protein
VDQVSGEQRFRVLEEIVRQGINQFKSDQDKQSESRDEGDQPIEFVQKR